MYLAFFLLIVVVFYRLASELPRPFDLIGYLILTAGFCFLSVFFLDMSLPGVNILSSVPIRLAPNHGNSVALTFDDGPVEPYTKEILEILDRFGMKATFFCIGENALKHPEVMKEMISKGHCVGNHSHRHRTLPFLGAKEIMDEIERGAQSIQKVTGVRPKLFRCPRGFKSHKVLKIATKLGQKAIGFSYPIFDVENPPFEELVQRVLTRVKPGDVILMHDGFTTRKPGSRDALVKALPEILKGLREKNITSVALDDVLI